MELYNEDCLEGMKRIPDGSIDAIITDPPFWTTACKWDSVIPFDPMWEQLKRIIKPNGAIVLFGSEPFSSALRMSNIKQYKYDWIWDKKWTWGFLNAKKRPLKRYENIMIFSDGKPVYLPQMEERWKPRNKWSYNKKKWDWDMVYWKFENILSFNNTYYPTDIIEISNAVNRDKVHPTQKPVALIEYLIKTYTNEWETVLDFTAGSFTTAIACENTNRKWICIEQDQWYFDIWINRLNNHNIVSV